LAKRKCSLKLWTQHRLQLHKQSCYWIGIQSLHRKKTKIRIIEKGKVRIRKEKIIRKDSSLTKKNIVITKKKIIGAKEKGIIRSKKKIIGAKEKGIVAKKEGGKLKIERIYSWSKTLSSSKRKEA